MPGIAEVEAYIAERPDWSRQMLEEIRAAVRSQVPDATETISYGMPTFKDATGRLLVSYAAFKDHCSLFPLTGTTVAGIGDAVRPYAAGKGTMQFKRGEPLPLDLIRQVVEIRLAENAAKGKRR
jgi:uncharacterized protein YdhG (YjbR/CyaY superfamily)